MSLVDSSAWIELLRGTESPAHLALRERLRAGSELSTTGPVAMELLAGARTAADRRRIKRTLAACRMLPVRNTEDWEGAAAVYATCRNAGVTPRRLLDCLIAAVAIRVGTPVLAQDRDFALISEHTALELAAP